MIRYTRVNNWWTRRVIRIRASLSLPHLEKLWDKWAIRWKREVSLFRPARERRERRGRTMQMELFAGRVHYDYFNNGNIRRAFDEKSEFNEKFTDEPRLWRYNYINNTGARGIGDRRFVIHTPPHKYNINTKGAKIVGHFTNRGYHFVQKRVDPSKCSISFKNGNTHPPYPTL